MNILYVLRKMVLQFRVKAALSVVLFSIISFTAALGQEVTFVKLEYITAVRPDNAHVKVDIFQDIDNSYRLKVEALSLWLKIKPQSLKPEVKPTTVEISITEEQFQKIVNSLQRIKQEDIIGGPHPSILDGSTCSISYGSLGTAVSFQVNTPGYDTYRRELSDFLEAFKLILTTANLDPKQILG
ncbi:hypothetical protein ACSX1A_06255 [Pontibacter sp. MBLB2868]|uniref:hypothetical protein n=1 Tax=Pontibacter sp. MBLB2868 TaxID=3451555 RepID=UPI003F74FFE9